MKKIFTNPVYVVIAAIICNILWGSAYPAIKSGYALFNITDGLFDKFLFAGIRFGVAGIVVLIIAGLKQKKIPTFKRENTPMILLVALIYTTLQYIFFYVGLSNTSGTNGSIVNSTSTFIAVILSHFIYPDDKLNIRKVIGFLLGFGGVLFVTVSGGNAAFSFTGEGFIFIAAFCFVIGSVLIKKLTGENAATVTGYNLLIGGGVLVVTGIIGGGHFEQVNGAGIAVLAYLVFLSAAAYTIWSALVRYNPVGKVSVYNFIIPVSGTIMSAIFLGEEIFDVKYLVSLVLVCAGIIIVNGKTEKDNVIKKNIP